MASAARAPGQQCAAGAGVDSAAAAVYVDELCAEHSVAVRHRGEQSGKPAVHSREHDQPAGEYGAELVRRRICELQTQVCAWADVLGELHLCEEPFERSGL